MKTHEEQVADFQQQFDQGRRKRVWKLLFQFPFWIILNGILLFAIFGTICLSIEEHTHFYLVGILLIIFGLIGNYAECTNFFETFNSIKKRKDVKKLLDEAMKQQAEWKEKRKSIEPVCDGGTIEIWMKLAVEYHSSDQYEISELILQEGRSLEDRILELEYQLEIYDNANEKNFWQYFKSKEWMKKIKN